jgi:molecular chaperone DnaK (HSP70)
LSHHRASHPAAGIKPVLTVNPETAVAEGAAVQAAILDGLPSAGNLAVFNPHHGGRLHQRRVLANAGGVGGADADA